MPAPVKVGRYEFDQAAYRQSAAAVLLGCTRQHVARMEKSGELRTVRLGRCVLVPAAEIARLLDLEGDQPGAGDAA